MNDDYPNAGEPVFHARYEEDEENNLPMPEHVLPGFEDKIVMNGCYRTTGTICNGSGQILCAENRPIHATIIQRKKEGGYAYWINFIGELKFDTVYGYVRDGYIVTRSQGGLDMWEFDREKRVAIKFSEYSKIEKRSKGSNGVRVGLLEDPFQEIRATQEVERSFIDGIHQPTVALSDVNQRVERARKIIDNWGIMTTIDVLEVSEINHEVDGVYVVMPHFYGDDLVKEISPLSPENRKDREEIARQRFIEMLNCVENLHNLHICHRDLSLENVMLHKTKNRGDQIIIVLIDLGAALKIPYNEEGRRCLIHAKKAGKDYCLAPEGWSYADRFTVDGVTLDLWALGVILHVMVTGYRPWGGMFCEQYDICEAYECVPYRKYDTLRELRILEEKGYKISERLKDLFRCMFEFKPEHRFNLNQIRHHGWTVGR